MSTTEAKIELILRRGNDELYGEGNLELIDEYLAEEYIEYDRNSHRTCTRPPGRATKSSLGN